MTHFLIVTFFIATRIFLINSTTESCGPDEVERAPGTDCKSDHCPVPEGQLSACDPCCASKCKCANLQEVYGPNCTCISARECPPIPCGPNQKFDSCPNSFCSENCTNVQPPTATGQRCRTIGRNSAVVICRPACTCIPDYWRTDEGKCVYYKDCPQFQRSCE